MKTYLYEMDSHQANQIVRKHRNSDELKWMGAATFEKVQMFKAKSRTVIEDAAKKLDIKTKFVHAM